VADAFADIVVAFGKFDGVHLGHRALLERGGRGGVLTFRRFASAEGLDGVEVGMVEVADGPVSATRIRASLRDGDVELAGILLGRPYEIAGPVRSLGPASVSVAVSAARAVPSAGTYLGSFWTRSHPKTAVIVEVGPQSGHRRWFTVRGEGVEVAGRQPAGLGHVAFRARF
jgi:FAD synthase